MRDRIQKSKWSQLCCLWCVGLLLAACGDDGSDSPGGPNVENVCGNRVVERFEQCDDGNDDPNDGCHECRFYTPPAGEPLEVTEDQSWQWFPFEGSVCRDGSTAGLSLNLAPDAKGLVVFFEGGGACFESMNCMANPKDITPGRRFPAESGIFERDRAENPFKDWSYLYLPYCSGDVFAGATSDVTPPGLSQPQQYQGAKNMQLFLDRVVPTIGGRFEKVVVTGISAGGMASLTNAFVIGRAFPEAELTVLDDGGPPLDTDVVPACLQEHWRTLWDLDATVLADCGADCGDPNDYMIDLSRKIARRYRLGVFSFETDATVRLLYSFGQNDCEFSPFNFIGAEVFAENLYELRELMRAGGASSAVDGEEVEFSSYFAPGSSHTCIQTGCFYDVTVDEVPLTEWVRDLVDGVMYDVGELDAE